MLSKNHSKPWSPADLKKLRALKADAAAIIGPGVRVWCDKEPASSAA